jgi:DNA helicase-4
VGLKVGSETFKLDGIPNENASDMVETMREAVIESVSGSIQKTARPLVAWRKEVLRALPIGRWITMEDVEAVRVTSQVPQSLKEILEHPYAPEATEDLPAGVREAIHFCGEGLDKEIARLNETFATTEVTASRQLFDSVERQPLTEEQARAVVCFDNRVLLVAAAGSGKTSTLVAKAAYALHRSIVQASEILMLAFNADAADELQERIRSRLGDLVVGADAIVARTFHSFGLSIIGEVTGRKPDLAPWLQRDNGVDELEKIIESLCVKHAAFITQWLLYRTVYADPFRGFDEREEPEDWDPVLGRAGFQTHRGEIVKSREERMIADWLFYNGVNYVYEGRYEVDTADATHRQYNPDFFYPDANLYHEHFALDADGLPPTHFENYLEGVHWKRQLHQDNNTELFETTSAQLRAGSALEALGRALVKRGMALDPRSDREVPGRPLPKTSDLAKSFRVFQAHAKSNRIETEELRERARSADVGGPSFRYELFLNLYERIAAEWDRRLALGNFIDFEDMLNMAADHVEAGRWTSPYRLILADEFQDSSRARARLLQSLVKAPGCYLFAVGDDWQSINRFSGADIGVMTDFERIFGKAQQLFLTTTFRCPQVLCNVAGEFVMRNPAQIRKVVRTTNTRSGTAVTCHAVSDDADVEALIGQHLRSLHNQVAGGSVAASQNGKVTVFLLGRYRHNCPGLLETWKAEYGDRLDISFYTVHGAKGLEADYIFLVHVIQGRYGLPSQIEDDPVHQLAMPHTDSFRFAEERRLFYVALTRARRLVLLYTVEHRISEFLVELSSAPSLIRIRRAEGEEASVNVCPDCRRGVLVRRNGKNGFFLGCTRFPGCRYTENDTSVAKARGPEVPSKRRSWVRRL